MNASELIKKEVSKIDSKINRHKGQIRKLEEQKFDLLCSLNDIEFKERNSKQFISRFEVDSFRHND